MKKFFNKLARFSLLILCLITIHSFLIYFVNKKIYKNYNLNIPTNPAYVVLGHSHPLCAFDDKLIDDFHNASSSGERFFYTYLKIKKIVADNPSIKTIFIELGDVQITASSDTIAWDDENIDNRLPGYSPLMKLEDYFFLLRKNPVRFARDFLSLPKKQAKRILEKNYTLDKTRENQIKVRSEKFIPLLEQENNPHDQSDSKKTNESKYNLLYLDKIIAFCKAKNLKIILLRSPVHKKWIRQNFENRLKDIIKRKYSKLKYLSFRDFSLSNEEFKDHSHLNKKGSKKFSIWFNKLLKEGILDSDTPQDIINEKIESYSD